MRFVDVKRIALYYKAIPGMLHLLRQERAELEEGIQRPGQYGGGWHAAWVVSR